MTASSSPSAQPRQHLSSSKDSSQVPSSMTSTPEWPRKSLERWSVTPIRAFPLEIRGPYHPSAHMQESRSIQRPRSPGSPSPIGQVSDFMECDVPDVEFEEPSPKPATPRKTPRRSCSVPDSAYEVPDLRRYVLSSTIDKHRS